MNNFTIADKMALCCSKASYLWSCNTAELRVNGQIESCFQLQPANEAYFHVKTI
jgi:hypothetical protein